MKYIFASGLLLFFCISFGQQKKVVDFSNIKYIDGVAHFDTGEKVNGAVSKKRSFGPYYEGLEKTFIFADGILVSEISYFTEVPENIISKQVYYYPHTTQTSKMIVYHDKKHKMIKTYEFYEDGKRKSIETTENGALKFQKNYDYK